MKHKYTEQQIEAIKRYYPDSNYDKLWEYFPNYSKREIKQVAKNNGVKNNNPGHRIDLTGQKFGRLTAIRFDHSDGDHKAYWKCKCDCGNEAIVSVALLRSGKTRSCGCLQRESRSNSHSKDHTGKKFGMLTAIERLANYKSSGRTYYRCICECGHEKIVAGSLLVTGHTKTCGCISRNKAKYREIIPKSKDTEKQCYLIYKHTAPNGKVYIGITRQDKKRRWQNGKGYNTQERFWRAIQKYGWENISHEILAEKLTEEEACKLEIQFIDEYRSKESRYGYNVSDGGSTGRTLVKPVLQYYQGKLVNFFESVYYASKKLKVSARTVENYIIGTTMIEGYVFIQMPEIHLYDIDPKLYDYEDDSHLNIRELMREQCRRKTIDRNKRNIKSINQYDLKGHYIRTYSSIAEAKKENPMAKNIAAVLRKQSSSKTTGGFQWKYNDGNTDDIDPIQPNGRTVIQIEPKTYEIVAEYFSLAEAERQTGINKKLIFKSCKRINQTAKGYIWRYKDDPNALLLN